MDADCIDSARAKLNHNSILIQCAHRLHVRVDSQPLHTNFGVMSHRLTGLYFAVLAELAVVATVNALQYIISTIPITLNASAELVGLALVSLFNNLNASQLAVPLGPRELLVGSGLSCLYEILVWVCARSQKLSYQS